MRLSLDYFIALLATLMVYSASARTTIGLEPSPGTMRPFFYVFENDTTQQLCAASNEELNSTIMVGVIYWGTNGIGEYSPAN